jgi:hypothetical protein
MRTRIDLIEWLQEPDGDVVELIECFPGRLGSRTNDLKRNTADALKPA